MVEGRFRFCTTMVMRTTCLAELVVLLDVKVVCLHEALLLGLESAMEVALEGGLCGGSEEEKVSKCKVHGSNEEAYGFHYVPTQLPESEPHEPKSLHYQEA